MKLHRVSKVLLFAVILSGVALLGYLLAGLEFNDTSAMALLTHKILASPGVWGYALVSAFMLLSFLFWIPFKLPDWRFKYAFRRVDSAALDNDCELCQQFYRAALAFLRRYGTKKFDRAVIRQFDFFYDYHNDALNWLSDIVNKAGKDPVPADFVVSSICSGQIGRVYSGACYGGGIPSVAVKFNETIYLHARMDSIEVWSANSSAPICILKRQPLKLQQGERHTEYLSCYLSGLEKATLKPRRLELRCQTRLSDTQEIDEQHARGEMQSLRTWISELAVTVKQSNQKNFGIHVDEIDAHDNHATSQLEQTPLAQLLQRMLGRQIDGYFTRAKLPIADPNIALDAVVLCGGLGIVAITEMKLAGSITYSGDRNWTQVEAEATQQFENTCLQAKRAKTSLAKLLSAQGLIKWPIHNLVVFTDPVVSLNLVVGKQPIQCNVVKLAQMENWFLNNSQDDTIQFSKDDYNRFIAVLDPTRTQLEKAMRA